LYLSIFLAIIIIHRLSLRLAGEYANASKGLPT